MEDEILIPSKDGMLSIAASITHQIYIVTFYLKSHHESLVMEEMLHVDFNEVDIVLKEILSGSSIG